MDKIQQITRGIDVKLKKLNKSPSFQVWRGSFLLADFILSKPDKFKGATVLELGAGMGFTSIVMATVAKTVYCTGVCEAIG